MMIYMMADVVVKAGRMLRILGKGVELGNIG